MAIKYYPNRVYRAQVPAIDRVLAKRKLNTLTGFQNTTSTALDIVVSSNTDWQLDTIGLIFNNSTPRDFYTYIQNGRKVVTDLNDYMWIQMPNDAAQKITLNSGFYDGTALALELKTRLDLNTSFIAQAGTPFAVAYSAVTGLFTITPNAGTARYLDMIPTANITLRDSICGHLFGLNATSAYGATITSDTAVYGLNTQNAFVNQAASTATSYYSNTIQTMSIDQAIHLTSNVAALTVNYEVTYEDII